MPKNTWSEVENLRVQLSLASKGSMWGIQNLCPLIEAFHVEGKTSAEF